MKLVSNSLDQIADEEKICEIAKSFGKQVETLYQNSMDEKVTIKRLSRFSISILNRFFFAK